MASAWSYRSAATTPRRGHSRSPPRRWLRRKNPRCSPRSPRHRPHQGYRPGSVPGTRSYRAPAPPPACPSPLRDKRCGVHGSPSCYPASVLQHAAKLLLACYATEYPYPHPYSCGCRASHAESARPNLAPLRGFSHRYVSQDPCVEQAVVGSKAQPYCPSTLNFRSAAPLEPVGPIENCTLITVCTGVPVGTTAIPAAPAPALWGRLVAVEAAVNWVPRENPRNYAVSSPVNSASTVR